jgi:hypothetical protein
MIYFLLISGIVVALAGLFAIVFGMAIRDTPFGTALLVSGTVALVGGFILVGLAAAVQELRRMVLAVRRMPAGLRPLRPLDRKDGDRQDGVRTDGERRDGDRRPPPQRALFSNRAGSDAQFPPPDSIDEPPFDAEVRADAGERADMDARANMGARVESSGRADQRPPPGQPGPAWLRRAIAEIQSVPPPVEQPAQRAQPPIDPYDEYRYDEPQPARRPLSAEAPAARPNAGARAPMQEGWARPRVPVVPAPAAVGAPPAEEPEPDRPPPRPAAAPPPNIFDMVWTNDRRRPASETAPAPAPEPRPEASALPAIRPIEPRPAPAAQSIPTLRSEARLEPRSESRPESRSEGRPELRSEPWPEPRSEARPESRSEARPVPRSETRPEPRSEHRPEPRSEPRPEPSPGPQPRPLSILKSGVIDEMAYTLFTDGSIEAQMPDGTMRFSSIEDLRRHLDQHG